MYRIQKTLTRIIALFVLASGIALTCLAASHFIMAFAYIGDGHDATGRMATALLHAVDLFLVAIVFFVLSIGMLVLFIDPEKGFPLKLPKWLHVESFVRIKNYTLGGPTYCPGGGLHRWPCRKKINGEELTIYNLV